MTRAQAQYYTDQISKAEDMLLDEMLELESFGISDRKLEEIYQIIQDLPEYVWNE